MLLLLIWPCGNGFLNTMGLLQNYISSTGYKLGGKQTGTLISLVVKNQTLFKRNPEPNLRRDEKQSSIVESPGCNDDKKMACYVSEAWIDMRWAVQFQSLLDIARVTFLLTVLSLGAVLFIRDTDSLVLQPIERMVQRVKLVSQNPLAANSIRGKSNEKEGKKQMETKVLERSIEKVCNLLSVGFGEAGAEIISNNIKSGGDINPMLPGKRVTAIFGFCDIRKFTDTTEILQEDIMEFVNAIASIVHAEVSFHGGAANKNIGDAFLVVWKLPEMLNKTTSLRKHRGSIIDAKTALSSGDPSSNDHEIARHLADAALASMIIINASLQRSPMLRKFIDRDDMHERMGDFKVKMGFGLHVGWAIEGAIGSKFKIDPSYLSPHVNMAARLEAATKQYDTPILCSDSFVSLLSPKIRERCRAIDNVLVKGSCVPTTLYTYDVKQSSINPSLLDHPAQQELDSNLAHITFSDYPYYDEFDEHPDILGTTFANEEVDEFLGTFREAYQAYIEGRWKESISKLQNIVDTPLCDSINQDGPSANLLKYMASLGGVPPADWSGCRELTEK